MSRFNLVLMNRYYYIKDWNAFLFELVINDQYPLLYTTTCGESLHLYTIFIIAFRECSPLSYKMIQPVTDIFLITSLDLF